jgi:hypothetical protein
MATHRSASPARRGRAHQAATRETQLGRHDAAEARVLREVIEIERDNLSKVDSILGCLVISMEYGSDSDNAPYYPDLVQLAREMVKHSIDGLDSLALQQRLMRNKVKDAAYRLCWDVRPAELGRCYS